MSYTQKELIKNAIGSLRPIARKYFIYAWLEDINWHTENTKFCERNFTAQENKLAEHLELLAIARSPHNYSKAFVESKKEELMKYTEALNKAGEHGLVNFGDGIFATQDDVRDFAKAQSFQQALSYMTGWGLSNEGWTATSGEPFIKDLEDLLAEFDAEDKKTAEVHEAYSRFND